MLTGLTNGHGCTSEWRDDSGRHRGMVSGDVRLGRDCPGRVPVDNTAYPLHTPRQMENQPYEDISLSLRVRDRGVCVGLLRECVGSVQQRE